MGMRDDTSSEVRRARDHMSSMMFSKSGRGVFAAALVALLRAAVGSSAVASSTIRLHRCGFVHARIGGRSAIYPWRLPCEQAKQTLAASDRRGVRAVSMAPGWGDGVALRLKGQWWVCTGNMGNYNCGYPYRPRRVHGGRGYSGPFTKDFSYQNCAGNNPFGCRRTTTWSQPRTFG